MKFMSQREGMYPDDYSLAHRQHYMLAMWWHPVNHRLYFVFNNEKVIMLTKILLHSTHLISHLLLYMHSALLRLHIAV